MYAGTTIGNKSGQLIGVHQRIDRVARKQLQPLIKSSLQFPRIARILHFEGNNGPDGVKRKSPSVDEPWHFINPDNPTDTVILEMIRDHQVNLAEALISHNEERAAFEAAWMAHAIVDGLTPAHHFPLADKIEELFGKPHYERMSIREKNIIKGLNKRDTLSKNWQYWGKHGIFMNHIMFEFGVAMSIVGQDFGKISIGQKQIDDLRANGFEETLHTLMKKVMAMQTYETYTSKGWSRQLAKTIRAELIPTIVTGVVLGWYESLIIMENNKGKIA